MAVRTLLTIHREQAAGLDGDQPKVNSLAKTG
jgi:hypothetical protein